MGEAPSRDPGEHPGGSRDRDQAIRDIVKGAGVVYVGLVLEMVIAFVAQVLTANSLSAGGFGAVTTGVAVVNLGGIIGAFGVGGGFVRYLPRYDDERKRRVVRTALLIVVPVSLVLGAAVSLRATFIANVVFDDPAVAPILKVFGATIPFSAAVTVSIGGIRGLERARYHVYVQNFLRPTIRFMLVAAAVTYGLGQMGFALAYAGPYVLGAIVATYLFARELPGGITGTSLDWRSTVEMIRYALPLTVSTLSGFLYRSLDLFLLLAIVGSDSVGVYGVAYGLARLVLAYSTAVNYISLPVLSEFDADERITEMLTVQRSVVRWMTIALVPAIIPLVIFPSVIIGFVYKPAYLPGASALAVLATGFAVSNVMAANGNLLKAVGSSETIAVTNIVAAGVNIWLNLVLIPRYEIMGAALATVVAYLVRDLLKEFVLYSKVGTPLPDRNVFGVVALSAPSILGLLLLKPHVHQSVPSVLVLTAAAAGVYIALVIGVSGFQAEDMMLLHSIEGKFGLDLWPLKQLVNRFS